MAWSALYPQILPERLLITSPAAACGVPEARSATRPPGQRLQLITTGTDTRRGSCVAGLFPV